MHAQSPAPDPASGCVRLQEVILDGSTPFGIQSTSHDSGLALADYLNAGYDGGAGAGRHVLLRLNTTVPLILSRGLHGGAMW